MALGDAGQHIRVLRVARAFGALLAVGLLGEPLAAYHLVALALVIGGIALAQRGRRDTRT